MKNFKCAICKKRMQTRFFRICLSCSSPELQRKYNLPYFISNKELHKRFWDKIIKKVSGCWEFPESLRNERGYANFSISYLTYRAHTIAWMIKNKKVIPKGMFVCHHCDNPPCVNPKHLFLGTRLDNSRDMKLKDRSLKGEKNPDHKLTEEQVIEIRELRKTQKLSMYKLAEMFNVTRPQIGHIINRIHWKHI